MERVPEAERLPEPTSATRAGPLPGAPLFDAPGAPLFDVPGPRPAAALGARLLAVAGLIQPGRVVADIGTDHGKLPLCLVAAAISPFAIAIDSREKPLQKARALAKRRGLEEKIDCRLGDGLAALAPGEAQEIVVAGLSGETIAAILAAASWVRSPGIHLVLCPSTRAPQLRRWLCEEGFALESETPVEEKDRPYTVLSARWGRGPHPPTDLFCEVGLLPDTGGPVAARLLQNRLADLNKRALGPLAQEERAALQTLINEVERCRACMISPSS